MNIPYSPPEITDLALQLDNIEQGLRAIGSSGRVPSIEELTALSAMRKQIRELDIICETLEPKLWKRVEKWIRDAAQKGS